MRSSSQNRSLSPKISIKQMRISPNKSPYHPLDFKYNHPHENFDPLNRNEGNNLNQYESQKTQNNYNYRYPQSHIQSQRSVDCQEILHIRQKQLIPQNRSRRRKIFQKKSLRARVIPDQYNYDNENSNQKKKQFKRQRYPEKQQSQYYTVKQYGNFNQLSKQQQFVTLKNLKVSKDKSRKAQNIRNNEYSPQKFNHLSEQQLQSSPLTIRTLGNFPSEFQSRQSFNYRTYQNFNRNQGTNRSMQQKNTRIHEQFNKNTNKNNFSNEKLPSFANNSNNEVQSQNNNKGIQLQTMIILSGLPQQVMKLKKQIRDQRRQLAQLDQKVQYNNTNHLRKQRQLIQSLIDQHQQLTNKQYELNESLQKMSKIQSESGQRYQKILKYELEMQRAQRIQNLCRQNQRLAQELLKNQSRDTADLTPLSHPLNINNTKTNSSSYYKRPISPLSSPVNNFTYHHYISSNQNTNRYFKQEYQKNWRQISALQAPYKCQQSYDNDNTLRQLLSPLEVKHQLDL